MTRKKVRKEIMKQIKLIEPWNIKLEETNMPEAGEGCALIKVRAGGICGSDIGAYRGTNPLVSYPRVIGHEIAGEIISVPENEKGLKPGDKVILDPYLYCGNCYPCSIKRTNCCVDLKVLGVHVDGGFAEYVSHPADMLIKAPADMEWELIPLAEPLTIALHGLHRAKLAAGEYIAISGAGPIGMLAAMAALHYGAIPILIDMVGERLELAKELGISRVVNLSEENLEEKINEYTNGRMAEVVMEASGAETAIQNSLRIISHAGRIILTGWPKKAMLLDTAVITKKELDIRGARTSAGEFEEAIELIYHKKINIKAILSETIQLEETPDMIEKIEKYPGNYMKVVVLFPERS